MSTPGQPAALLDFHQENASSTFLPQPATLASSGWDGLHFELHQQPAFEVAEHQHTMHVIAYGLSSASVGARWLDGKRGEEARHLGDVAIVPAGIAHRCSWNAPAQFAVLAVEPVLLQQVGQGWIESDRIELVPRYMQEQDALIQGVLLTLKNELETEQMGGWLLIDSLRTALAVHLLRRYCTIQPKPASNHNGLSQRSLQQVVEYIRAHLHQDLKLVDIAAIAQLSPYHFLRLFKQSLGMTPHQYILRCRITKAKRLLQSTQLSIAEIALQTGFCDQSHLTRSFRRVVGVTPKRLQQTSQQESPKNSATFF